MRMPTFLSRPLSRWAVPVVLAAGLGFAAMTPAPVHAQDNLTRVLVNLADVVFNNGTPYYRYGDYSNNDRLVVGRDAYGRPVYYRQTPYNGYDQGSYNQGGSYDRYGRRIYDQYGRRIDYSRYNSQRNAYRNAPPYGNAYGYYRNGPGSRGVKCNKHGKCKDRNEDRSDDHDHDHDGDGDGDRGWDDRRGHDDDND